LHLIAAYAAAPSPEIANAPLRYHWAVRDALAAALLQRKNLSTRLLDFVTGLLEEASMVRNKDALVRLHLGIAYLMRRDTDGAKVELQRALDLDPNLSAAREALRGLNPST
jgi:Tfp pilus assembly protein PilF